MSDGVVRKWVRMFNEGRQNVHYEARSGRPSLVNVDLARKVKERVRDDRRFTISDPSLHFPHISTTLLYGSVSRHLGYRKVCARWVPKMLTDEHKEQHRLKISKPHLSGDKWTPPSPYNPDLTPSDFHPFLRLKKFLGGERFDDDDDPKDKVQKWHCRILLGGYTKTCAPLR